MYPGDSILRKTTPQNLYFHLKQMSTFEVDATPFAVRLMVWFFDTVQ